MRYWSMVLHFYQPPTQEVAITKQILNSCYFPILHLLDHQSDFGLTLNLSGSLILQLQEMHEIEFFNLVRKLLAAGKIELLNSAVYHPIIPLTPSDVVDRQIIRNGLQIKNFFGLVPEGFFPPELAIDQTSLDLIKNQFIIIDQTSLDVKTPLAKFGSKYLLVNHRPVSELLRSYPRKLSVQTVVDLVNKGCPDGGLLVTANDAELFGHHYVERIRVLKDLLDQKDIKFITASQAISQFGDKATTVANILPSTWQDCQQFALWNKNDLQQNYLKLLAIGHDLTQNSQVYKVDDYLDQSYSSCYPYWLSNWPWWHPDLVQSGAKSLVTAVRISQAAGAQKIDMENHYYEFLNHLWQYQWSGQVEANYQKYNHSPDKFLGI